MTDIKKTPGSFVFTECPGVQFFYDRINRNPNDPCGTVMRADRHCYTMY